VRVVLGATLVVAGVAIPMWPSVLAVIVMGYLAFEGFRLSSKPKSGPGRVRTARQSEGVESETQGSLSYDRRRARFRSRPGTVHSLHGQGRSGSRMKAASVPNDEADDAVSSSGASSPPKVVPRRAQPENPIQRLRAQHLSRSTRTPQRLPRQSSSGTECTPDSVR
jgi:hypothetical protein